MIAHRRTWLYRLAGEDFAQTLSIPTPVTASQVREALRKLFGSRPFELWGR